MSLWCLLWVFHRNVIRRYQACVTESIQKWCGNMEASQIMFPSQQTMAILWQLQDELLSWTAILGNHKTKCVALDERYKCTADMIFNSLIPGRCDYTFKCVILKPILMTSEFSFSDVIALMWMIPILHESILIQVMALCHKVMKDQASNIHNEMKSSNGNITGPLCREFPGPGEFPTQRPVTWIFDVFFDLGLNKLLSKHSRCKWFEMPSCSLWRHCNKTWLTLY